MPLLLPVLLAMLFPSPWASSIWETYRTEILVTALIVLSIQLITGLGGLVQRRNQHMRRIEDPGEGSGPK